ncbi:MAG: hypothetical protein QXQ33_00800 [Nitrososphaerota archaeon]
MVYRQGDVVLVRLHPDEEARAKFDNQTPFANELVISSETGNAHKLCAPVYEAWGRQYVVLEHPTILEHPQHKNIVIEPGIYEVRMVRSYNKASRSSRRVSD